MSKPSCHSRTVPLLDQASAPDSLAQSNSDRDHNDLVRLIAWQIFSRIPRYASVEVSDLLQAGHLGLLRAHRSYRSECDVPFAVYARFRIRGEILDMLRRLDHAPRSLRRWQKALETQTRDLSLRLQRLPTDEELSEKLGVEIGQVRRNRQILACSSRDSSRKAMGDDDSASSRHESIAAIDWMPDFIQERKESCRLLLQSIARLAPRERRVVLLYYRQNLTMKQIGALLQVKESRISQIHKNAIQTMSALLQSPRTLSARKKS